MMAGLSFNFQFAAKCACTVLGLLYILNIPAQAQPKRLSLAVASGYSKAYNNAHKFPFTEADNGFFIQISGMLPFGKNWGGIANLEQSYLNLNTSHAASAFFDNDPNATAISIESNRFTMVNNGIGIYYDWNIGSRFFARLAPIVGYANLITPRIIVSVDTEPYTRYTYRQGGNSALFYSLSIRPAVRIAKEVHIYLPVSYSYASYNVSSSIDGVHSNTSADYKKLNIGLGVGYGLPLN